MWLQLVMWQTSHLWSFSCHMLCNISGVSSATAAIIRVRSSMTFAGKSGMKTGSLTNPHKKKISGCKIWGMRCPCYWHSSINPPTWEMGGDGACPDTWYRQWSSLTLSLLRAQIKLTSGLSQTCSRKTCGFSLPQMLQLWVLTLPLTWNVLSSFEIMESRNLLLSCIRWNVYIQNSLRTTLSVSVKCLMMDSLYAFKRKRFHNTRHRVTFWIPVLETHVALTLNEALPKVFHCSIRNTWGGRISWHGTQNIWSQQHSCSTSKL
jgi:hypothetical protein